MRSSNAQNTVPMIMKTIAPYLDVQCTYQSSCASGPGIEWGTKLIPCFQRGAWNSRQEVIFLKPIVYIANTLCVWTVYGEATKVHNSRTGTCARASGCWVQESHLKPWLDTA